MASVHVEAVVEFGELLNTLLQEAARSKPTNTIEPALTISTLGDISARIEQINGLGKSKAAGSASQNAVIETAIRDAFNGLLGVADIDDPGFIEMWNLLDIVAILADDDQCDAALFFWLVEELLDSQTIAGCRKVFDYLESRRELVTSKYFDKKHLAILRTCNELLRRLSRAEDTAFCGRVFIFLFQCFPLGDKSSVNLRGEYHTENVTTFDQLQPESEDIMEVDDEPKDSGANTSTDTKVGRATPDAKGASKSVSFDSKNPPPNEKPLEPDTLYPIFWTLQQFFSQPKKLFDTTEMEMFKKGLESTMVSFEAVQKEQISRGPTKLAEESKRGTKRKRNSRDGDLADAFNPKYLTSRDLFELEISDLSFRRHIAVQALIVLDFMLSLSPKAKEKQATITPQNKSVMYQDQVLTEADCTWVLDMKKQIADYLKRGFEGPFFHRMVETVLSRDKNWVRWKIESCPPIQRPPVSAVEYLKARATVKKISTNKRLRPHPQASLDFTFLTNTDGDNGMERLKKPRYPNPALSDFRRMIADDDFEIEMPTNDETKDRAITGKASKSWRALRIAGKSKLTVFDKIDDPEKLDVIFKEEEVAPVLENGLDTLDTDEEDMPEDCRPIVITGPDETSIAALIKEFVDSNPKVFAKCIPHTTRPAREDESRGTDYFFIGQEEYNMMRDGDQFLQHNSIDGNDYGTSRKTVEGIIAKSRIPLLQMDHEGIQQFRDNAHPARYIFLSPPSLEDFERRLRVEEGNTEETVTKRLKAAEEELSQSRIEGSYDAVLLYEDLVKACVAIKSFIYGKGVEGGEEVQTGDASGEANEDETVVEAASTNVAMDEAVPSESKAED